MQERRLVILFAFSREVRHKVIHVNSQDAIALVNVMDSRLNSYASAVFN